MQVLIRSVLDQSGAVLSFPSIAKHVINPIARRLAQQSRDAGLPDDVPWFVACELAWRSRPPINRTHRVI